MAVDFGPVDIYDPSISTPRENSNVILAYDEFVDFLASGSTPQSVVDFRPSDTTKSRVVDLIQRQKSTALTDAELGELNQYMQIEHFMRLAKARARQRLIAG